MELEFIRKTRLSQETNCPAVYRTETGFVVQGRPVDPADVPGVRDLGEGEVLVWVPLDVLAELAGVTG